MKRTWKIMEAWDQMHLMLPGTFETVCHYRSYGIPATLTTDNLAMDVNCVECLNFAQVMHIPTAILGE